MTTQQLPLDQTDKPKILVIEDNADQWFIIQWALRQRLSEVEPIWIADANEALVYLETCLEQLLDLPRLILLDLYLPNDKIGLKTLQLLKKPDKLYHDIPVIVLSQLSTKANINACYERGANSYVTKPTTHQQWLDCFANFRAYWWNQVELPDLTRWTVNPRSA
ncbi:MAG: response regulator [Hymenobacter sp.]|nr:MAG: response regulator [Hymenobacter sp.]